MFFWLSCIMAGCAICLLLWVVSRPWLKHEGRRDGARPALLRLVWPWVSALASLSRPFISWRGREVLLRRLGRAGKSAILQPEHLVALQILCAATMGGLAASVLLAFPSFGGDASFACSALAACAGAYLPRHWLGGIIRLRQRLMFQAFPFLLDMTTLCVEAGLNLQGALQQAARHGPPGPLRDELRHALADMRAGMPRAEALRQLALRTDLLPMHQLVAALSQADKVGMSLGPLLRAQAEQRRSERFMRAEKLAQEAPVKMLFPMVFCIFPCTFLILGFPIVIKLTEGGL